MPSLVFTGCLLSASMSIVAIGFLLLLGDASAFPGSAAHLIAQAWNAFGPGLVFIATACYGVVVGLMIFGRKQIAKWHHPLL